MRKTLWLLETRNDVCQWSRFGLLNMHHMDASNILHTTSVDATDTRDLRPFRVYFSQWPTKGLKESEQIE